MPHNLLYISYVIYEAFLKQVFTKQDIKLKIQEVYLGEKSGVQCFSVKQLLST